MTLHAWYWIILVIAILFGGLSSWRAEPYWRAGFNVVLVVLLIIIGLIIAGSPIK